LWDKEQETFIKKLKQMRGWDQEEGIMNQKSKTKETIGQRRRNHNKEIAKPKRSGTKKRDS
jgi:hypothetical protein